MLPQMWLATPAVSRTVGHLSVAIDTRLRLVSSFAKLLFDGLRKEAFMFHSFDRGKSVSAECYAVNCDAQEGAEK